MKLVTIAVFLLLLNVAGEDLTSWMLLAPLLIAGLGNGLFIAPNAQFIVATVDRSEAGSASGVISVMQRVGSAIGIAVIGSVLFGTLHITSRDPAQIQQAFVDSAAHAMAVSAALSIVAFALVFVLPRKVNAHGGPPPAE